MPVYNEGEAVEPVIRALDAGVRAPHEILVVYDFDGDPTVPAMQPTERRACRRPRAAERSWSRRPQGDAGWDRCIRRAVHGHLDGRRFGRAGSEIDRWSASPATARTWWPRVGTCAAVTRSAGRSIKRVLSRAAGLTLHWFAGVSTHDATNNFKLYRRSYLATVTIESTAGLRAGARAHGQGDAGGQPCRRSAHDLARSERRREQLQVAHLAAALRALVSRGVSRSAGRRRAAQPPGDQPLNRTPQALMTMPATMSTFHQRPSGVRAPEATTTSTNGIASRK